jgi:archaellum component FlaC
LALKNKYNNEKEEMDKFVRTIEEEIKRGELSNKNKKHKIEILKREYEEISQSFNIYKDKTTNDIKS